MNRLSRGEVLLLDVREQQEVDFCRIEGSVHIPLGQVEARALGELNLADNIVVYCHVGVRSLAAARLLRVLGFENVANLAGGIDAWSLYVDPSVQRY